MAALRLHLPPNLAAAAARDAVALRIELGPGEPDAALVPALALLQGWCGTPRPPSFIQLSRRQLGTLAAAAAGEAIFVEAGKAVPWGHDEVLREPDPLPAAVAEPAATPRAARRLAEEPREPLVVDGSEHYLAVTLPSREDRRYPGALDLVKGAGFVLEPSNRRWWLRDRHKTLSFLATHGERLRTELGAQFTPNFTARTAHLSPAEIVCEALPSGDGWDVAIGLRAGAANEAAVRDAVATGRPYIEADGKVILVDPARLQRMGKAQRALSDGTGTSPTAMRRGRIGAARAAEVEELMQELSPAFKAPGEWSAQTAALRNLSRLEEAPIPAGLTALLRPYQRLGAAWLWHLQRHGLGGILADEMGLGKTLQALALLCTVSGNAPSLVVCPASLIENWRREAARFAPHLRVFVHHGERRLGGAAEFAGWDLVVTSYGTLTRDRDLFSSAEFACVIGDEAQHVKNARSQNARALRSLKSRGRFLLTGTPVENSLDDLRSLFDFILPGYVERMPAGARTDERAWLDERLRSKAAHYILRRTKGAVAPELPARIEQVVWCAFEPAQGALYRSFHEKSEREMIDLEASGAGDATLRLAALTQILRLRQICCDPRLVAGEGAPPAPGPFGGSAKLEAFREILAEALDDGHRILVFSQFTSLLALLREELDSQEITYCYLDGSMTPAARQAQIDRFQASPEVPVFLLSLKAGGAGLNLTGADTVVHFDPWWNPAAEAQATDRAHRIGQTRVVTSYKLVCSESVEETVLALQDVKRALLAGVFEASDDASGKLTLGDLKALLSSG